MSDDTTPDTTDAEPDQSDQNESADTNVKIYAKIDSLAVDGTPPAVGDEVDLTVHGKVDSVEGDVVCVNPITVNDEPAPPAPEGNSSSDNPSTDELRANADNANYA